jgi:ribokinase
VLNRCFEEFEGLHVHDILPTTTKTYESAMSTSYPGLPSDYFHYVMCADLSGVPLHAVSGEKLQSHPAGVMVTTGATAEEEEGTPAIAVAHGHYSEGAASEKRHTKDGYFYTVASRHRMAYRQHAPEYKEIWRWYREAELEHVLFNDERSRGERVLLHENPLRGGANAHIPNALIPPSSEGQGGATSMLPFKLYTHEPDSVLKIKMVDVKKKLVERFHYEEKEYNEIAHEIYKAVGKKKELGPEGLELGPEGLRLLDEAVMKVRVRIPASAESDRPLLEMLHPQCCRVICTELQGGYSGANVLAVRSFDAEGKAALPTVVKCDKLRLVVEEIKKTEKISNYLGVNYPKIMLRVPHKYKEVLAAVEEGQKEPRGAVKMQFVGSALVLPELHQDTSAKLMTQFKDIYEARLALLKANGDPSKTAQVKAGQNGIDLTADPTEVLHDVFEILAVPTFEYAKKEKINVFDMFPFQTGRQKHSLGNWLQWFGLDRFNEMYHPRSADGKELKPKRQTADNNPDTLEQIDGEITAYLRDTFWDAEMEKAANEYDKEHWVGLIHGDLNGANILVDTAKIISLIDFAFTEKSHVFVDLAKVETTILFEYTTLGEGDMQEAKNILDQLYGDEDVSGEQLHLDVDVDKYPTLFLAIECIRVIRHFTHLYSRDDPNILPFYCTLFSFAIKSTTFIDTSIWQKKFAMYACKLYGEKIRSIVLPKTKEDRKKSRAQKLVKYTTAESTKSIRDAEAKKTMNEVKKYCVQTEILQCTIVDAVSRDAVAAEDCVSMDFVEGDTLKDVEHNSRSKHNIHPKEPEDILKIARTHDVVVLLGEAASGKSTYMRKCLKAALKDMQNTFEARAAEADPNATLDGVDQPMVVILVSAMQLGNALRKQEIVRHENGYACPAADPQREDTGTLLQAFLLFKHGKRAPRYKMLAKQLKDEEVVKLLLIDGLDEAGDQKDAIIFISVSMVEAGIKLLISSRVAGFRDSALKDLKCMILKLSNLSPDRQEEIMQLRLKNETEETKQAVKDALKQQTLLDELKGTPLMLSLLILVLKQGTSRKTEIKTSSSLVRLAMELMLTTHPREKLSKQQYVGENASRKNEETLRHLASLECQNLLQHIAFRAHSKKTTEVKSADLVSVVKDMKLYEEAGEDKDKLYLQLKNLLAVHNTLLNSIYSNIVPLLDKRREFVNSNHEADRVIQFSHLTFQEFLAGGHIATQMGATSESEFESKVVELCSSGSSTLLERSSHATSELMESFSTVKSTLAQTCTLTANTVFGLKHKALDVAKNKMRASMGSVASVVKLHDATNSGLSYSLPYSVDDTNLPKSLERLRPYAKKAGKWSFRVSPTSKLTLEADVLEKIHVPKEATQYCFAYPMTGLQKLGPSTQRFLGDNDDTRFLVFGGYMYLDKDQKVLATNAIAVGNDIRFKQNPFPLTEKASTELEKAYRFVDTSKQMRLAGALTYAMLCPREFMSAQFNNTNGGFAFKLNDGTKLAFLIGDRDKRTDTGGSALFKPKERVSLNRLHDMWWRQAIIYGGSQMGDQLLKGSNTGEKMIRRFAKVLLEYDDASGANASMVKTMLAACETINVDEAEAEVKARIDDIRPLKLLVRGLSSRSSELRHLMVAEIDTFHIEKAGLVNELLKKLEPSSGSACRQYVLIAVIESLGLLRPSGDTTLSSEQRQWICSAAAHIWVDETTPPLARQAAGKTICSFDMAREKEVQDNLLRMVGDQDRDVETDSLILSFAMEVSTNNSTITNSAGVVKMQLFEAFSDQAITELVRSCQKENIRTLAVRTGSLCCLVARMNAEQLWDHNIIDRTLVETIQFFATGEKARRASQRRAGDRDGRRSYKFTERDLEKLVQQSHSKSTQKFANLALKQLREQLSLVVKGHPELHVRCQSFKILLQIQGVKPLLADIQILARFANETVQDKEQNLPKDFQIWFKDMLGLDILRLGEEGTEEVIMKYWQEAEAKREEAANQKKLKLVKSQAIIEKRNRDEALRHNNKLHGQILPKIGSKLAKTISSAEPQSRWDDSNRGSDLRSSTTSSANGSATSSANSSANTTSGNRVQFKDLTVLATIEPDTESEGFRPSENSVGRGVDSLKAYSSVGTDDTDDYEAELMTSQKLIQHLELETAVEEEEQKQEQEQKQEESEGVEYLGSDVVAGLAGGAAVMPASRPKLEAEESWRADTRGKHALSDVAGGNLWSDDKAQEQEAARRLTQEQVDKVERDFLDLEQRLLDEANAFIAADKQGQTGDLRQLFNSLMKVNDEVDYLEDHENEHLTKKRKSWTVNGEGGERLCVKKGEETMKAIVRAALAAFARPSLKDDAMKLLFFNSPNFEAQPQVLTGSSLLVWGHMKDAFFVNMENSDALEQLVRVARVESGAWAETMQLLSVDGGNVGWKAQVEQRLTNLPLSSDANLDNLIEQLESEDGSAFAFEILMKHLRTQRAETADWELADRFVLQIEGLSELGATSKCGADVGDMPGVLEAMFLVKEIKVGRFESKLDNARADLALAQKSVELRSGNVMVIGAISMDVVVEVDTFPQASSSVTAIKIDNCAGGFAANKAVATQKLWRGDVDNEAKDLSAILIGRVGANEIGTDSMKYLRHCKVDVSCVGIDPKVRTGTALIVRTKDEKTKFAVPWRGANDFFGQQELEHVKRQLDDDPRVSMSRYESTKTKIGIVFLQLEIPQIPLMAIANMETVKERTVVLRGSPLNDVSDMPQDLLYKVDVLILNEYDAPILLEYNKLSPEELATKGLDYPLCTIAHAKTTADEVIMKYNLPVVIITTPVACVCCLRDKDWFYIPRMHNVKVVDMSGSFDAFVGGFLSALGAGQKLRKALVRAMCCESYSTQSELAQNSFPDFPKLEKFIKWQTEEARTGKAAGYPFDKWNFNRESAQNGHQYVRIQNMVIEGKVEQLEGTISAMDLQAKAHFCSQSNQLDFQGQTLLHLAVLAGQAEVVKLLTQEMGKAAITSKDHYGLTPLCRARELCRLPGVKDSLELCKRFENIVTHLKHGQGLTNQQSIHGPLLVTGGADDDCCDGDMARGDFTHANYGDFDISISNKKYPVTEKGDRSSMMSETMGRVASLVRAPKSPKAGVKAKTGVIVFGMMSQDFIVCAAQYPTPGSTIRAEALTVTAGGKAANEAVALSRLEVPVALVSRVGDGDSQGKKLKQAMIEAHVNIDHVQYTERETTAISIVLHEKVKLHKLPKKCTINYSGCSMLMDETDVAAVEKLLDAQEEISYQYLLLQLSPLKDPGIRQRVAELAKAKNRVVLLKASPLWYAHLILMLHASRVVNSTLESS